MSVLADTHDLEELPDFEPMPEDTADPEARAQAWAERCGQAEVRAEAAERALHALLAELGHPTADTRRVPIQRADHDVLSDIANMLGRQIALLEHISGKLATNSSSDSRSSATVKTSARGYDLEVHDYDDGHLSGALDGAIAQYARGLRELAALQANQWAEAVEAVKNGAGK